MLRNLFEEVGWEHDLAEDPGLVREELRVLNGLLAAWELRDPVLANAQPRPGSLGRGWRRITGRSPALVRPCAPLPAFSEGGGADRGTDDSAAPLHDNRGTSSSAADGQLRREIRADGYRRRRRHDTHTQPTGPVGLGRPRICSVMSHPSRNPRVGRAPVESMKALDQPRIPSVSRRLR